MNNLEKSMQELRAAIAGHSDALDTLQSRYRVALASNAPMAKIEAIEAEQVKVQRAATRAQTTFDGLIEQAAKQAQEAKAAQLVQAREDFGAVDRLLRDELHQLDTAAGEFVAAFKKFQGLGLIDGWRGQRYALRQLGGRGEADSFGVMQHDIAGTGRQAAQLVANLQTMHAQQ
ncbi:hypothetical protein [Rhodoferax sp.]|uniref:hypothetical protein n=1 Tax=Rhodoferax sp. TaxID=50421 RepID=UPI0025F10DC8|nr:hypothetical protein [Rhodoferax sp.]